MSKLAQVSVPSELLVFIQRQIRRYGVTDISRKAKVSIEVLNRMLGGKEAIRADVLEKLRSWYRKEVDWRRDPRFSGTVLNEEQVLRLGNWSTLHMRVEVPEIDLLKRESAEEFVQNKTFRFGAAGKLEEQYSRIAYAKTCYILGEWGHSRMDLFEAAEAVGSYAYRAAWLAYSKHGLSVDTGMLNILLIRRIYVAKALRGKGLGKYILNKAINYHAPSEGCLVLTLPEVRRRGLTRDQIEEKDAELRSICERVGFRPCDLDVDTNHMYLKVDRPY